MTASKEPPNGQALIRRGPIAWVTGHPVAANLLMLVLILGGFMSAFSVKQEVFPEFPQDVVTVAVPYPGASPAEVEQGVVLAVEEAVRGVDGVKRVTSTAREGVGTVSVELLLDADPDRALSDITNEVNRIQSFPKEAEEPVMAIAARRREVVSLVISGDQDLRTLHQIAEDARTGLLASPHVTQAELDGVRPLEIAIEVNREALEAYGLSLEQVAAQVSQASIETPGGRVDTDSGQVLVRVADRRRERSDFQNIVLRGTEHGYGVRLGDVATITDGYADTDEAAYYNGKRGVRVTAYRTGNETPTEVATAVKDYAKELRSTLPETITVSVWQDDSELLEDRIQLLTKNAIGGLILVLIVLGLFLQRRLAFWVAVGIPISFLGAFLVLNQFDASINMITLFAFILTLGMVVDDAIVVGENIYEKIESGMPRMAAAVTGAREMAVPVTFSILTTMAAFAPLFFIPGTMGKLFKLIPAVVVSVLVISLVESFFILPAHLGHQSKPPRFLRPIYSAFGILARPIDRGQAAMSRGLERFSKRVYRPSLEFALKFRHATVAVGVASLVMVGAAVGSGLIPFSFFPAIEGDLVTATAKLPFGSPLDKTLQVRRKLQDAFDRVVAESGGPNVIRGMFTTVGREAEVMGPHGGAPGTGSHLLSIQVQLTPSKERDFSAEEFSDRWRDALPPLPGLQSLSISGSFGPSAGKAVDIQLSHQDTAILAQASASLDESLRAFETLTNVENTYSAGLPQLDYRLRPEARALGVTSRDLAHGVRSSFFGAEALREQRGRNEVKVMVRLPKSERESESDIERLMVMTPRGGYTPVSYLADVTRGQAPSEIKREEGRRTVNVSAGVAKSGTSAQPTIALIQKEVLPALLSKYSGLEASLVGERREQNESMASLGKGFLFAIFAIFALLAIPFRSYLQPLIVMSAIPFGIVGAVIGHVIMGFGLSMISVLGIIALAGVVVNDSLVLIDSTNRYREQGLSAWDAVIQGGLRRLRPILLTSLTTFFGLLPMMFETSMQARFLIPMAISLGYGALFVTFIVLLIVPALYLLVEDLRGVRPSEEAVPPLRQQRVGELPASSS